LPKHAAFESGVPDEPTGILALPHFAGAATPYMDRGAMGVLAGLSLGTTPALVYRALMEGIACEMRINRERLAANGVPITALRATGGCARSPAWLQMKADILGVPVTRMETDEAGAAGCAMMAGVAAGVWKSLEEASGLLAKPLETLEPRPDKQEAYDRQYRRYRGLYRAVRPLL